MKKVQPHIDPKTVPTSELDEYEEIYEEQEEPDLDSISESAITTTDWTVETIVGQIGKGNIELNPQFQRRFAWTDVRRSQFIESLALRYPVPQIVLARDRKRPDRLLVLDGKQRLLTLAQFFGVKKIGNHVLGLPLLTLKSLRIKRSWNGETVTALRKHATTRRELEVLANVTIRSVIISNWASEEFLYSIFVRLNQGSLPLSPQELRQALKSGPFTLFADKYAANSPGLRAVLGLEKPDFRMRDVELLIRFLAFQFRAAEYNGNLKQFLDDTCDYFNKNWHAHEDEVADKCRQLERSIESATKVFGDGTVFRKYSKDGYESRINRAVFDVVAYAFASPLVRKKVADQRVAENLVENFEALCLNARFRKSIESTTKSLDATRTRFGLFLRQVKKTTGQDVSFDLA